MTALHTQGLLTLGRWASANGGPEIQYTNGATAQQVFNCQPMDSADHAENARRLVACWNAFDGVETAMVECYTASRDWPLIEQLRIEVAAARLLLADAVEAFDEFPAEDHEIADRIRTFLGPKP